MWRYAVVGFELTRSLRSLRSLELMALRAAGGAGSRSAVSFYGPQPGEAAYGGARRPPAVNP